jgi:hypothetical protein
MLTSSLQVSPNHPQLTYYCTKRLRRIEAAFYLRNVRPNREKNHLGNPNDPALRWRGAEVFWHAERRSADNWQML